ncbi:MAG: hypothetical protein HQL19_08635 [Candidatus Omnitrophica bacterium]|nr:hypothetical protein [Candidatus Omnitrophota bacterium]
MQNSREYLKRVMVLVCLGIFVTVGFSGCATLRRKFTRKKAGEDTKQDVMPVLQPIEYAAPVHTPLDTYQTHYAVWRAYFNDLWEDFGKKSNGKRENFILTQVVAKMNGMADLLSGEPQAKLQALAVQVQDVMAQLDKPEGVRRYDLLKSALRKVEAEVRRSFKPDVMKKNLQAGHEAAH